jgi:hypothetical protein
VADAPTSVTPQQVRNLSIAGLFATGPDAIIANFIRIAANTLGSVYAQAHQQREDAVALLAAHLLWLQMKAEVAFGGGGGGAVVGVITSLSLTGVGSMGFGIQAQSIAELNDWLTTWSPWSVQLHAIIDSFGPAMFVTGMDGTELVSP